MDDHTKKTHFKLIRFIIESSIKLCMTSLTQATACRIYHEFYKQCSIGDWDPFLIACTCLYLAGKAEEEHLRIRDILNVTYSIYHRDGPPLDLDTLYYFMRESVAKCELYVLRVLAFNTTFSHPHKFLLHYLKTLHDWLPSIYTEVTSNKTQPVASTAWSFLKDSYHSPICTEYRCEHIAVAILYLTFEVLSIKVPYNESAVKKWWEVLSDDVDIVKIHEISGKILSTYELE